MIRMNSESVLSLSISYKSEIQSLKLGLLYILFSIYWSILSRFTLYLSKIILIIIFRIKHLSWKQYKTYYLGDCSNLNEICVPDDDRYYSYINFSLILLVVNALISSINLAQTIYFRINAEPDYQIMTPKVRLFLKSKTPHKNEIFLFIFATITQMSYFFEFTLITAFGLHFVFGSENGFDNIALRSYNCAIFTLSLVSFKLLF